ncbi:MAG: hypothetical protein ACREEC_12070 [Thermoplasmata archaeon]
MSLRKTAQRQRSNRLGLPLLTAATVLGATATPASALLFTSQLATSTAIEPDATGTPVSQAQTKTSTAAPADAKVQLGDGTDAFGQPTFAEAFSTFRGNVPTYWAKVEADNILSSTDLGRGEADVRVNYTVVKQHGDRSFNLNVTGGSLQLVDPEAHLLPLDAEVDLEARITHGTSLLRDVVATARLSGHGGTFATETFDLDASGFDFNPDNAFILLDDGGNNVTGVVSVLPKMKIPVDLDGITDGTALDIDISLFAEANAPGGETEAFAFLRDPAHADDPDLLAGGSSITITTDAGGPVSGVPEPSGLALLAPALLALRCRRRDPRSGLR